MNVLVSYTSLSLSPTHRQMGPYQFGFKCELLFIPSFCELLAMLCLCFPAPGKPRAANKNARFQS